MPSGPFLLLLLRGGGAGGRDAYALHKKRGATRYSPLLISLLSQNRIVVISLYTLIKRAPHYKRVTSVAATVPPSYYRIMARPSKHKQLLMSPRSHLCPLSIRATNERLRRVRQRKVRKIQEERGWESSEAKEEVTALGLLSVGK